MDNNKVEKRINYTKTKGNNMKELICAVAIVIYGFACMYGITYLLGGF